MISYLRVLGPASVGHPECSLVGGSVFLGYDHGRAVPRPPVQAAVPHWAPGVGGDGVLVGLVVGVAVVSSDHVDLVMHLVRDGTKPEVKRG